MFSRRFPKVVALFQRDAVCTTSRFLSIFEKFPKVSVQELKIASRYTVRLRTII